MICLCLLALGTAASPAAAAPASPADARYALVHGCYALKSKALGRFVARTPNGGYAASAPVPGQGAEPFRMQATALGRYLFYGFERNFMAGAPDDAVETQAGADDSADWSVDNAPGGGFTIALPSAGGKVLAVTGNEGRVILAPAGAGDAAVFTFEGADGCPAFPEVEVSASGTPGGGLTPYGETKGTLDSHMHMMAFEFLGGRAHCGRPWHRYGVEYALVDCPDHYPIGQSPLENAVSSGAPGPTHDPVGWPTFKTWPHHESLTHEQSYYKWLERAWMGGLRVYVNLFVENKVLCEIYPFKQNSCDEMTSVRLQNKRIRELEDYIDAQSGGPGKGWFRIVTDPFQARRVINQGKLAVILGIEISQPFGCRVYNDVPQCDRARIDRELDEVWGFGVRQMELVNKFDNALAGVAGDAGSTGVLVNSANRLETGKYWEMQACTGPADETDRENPGVYQHDEKDVASNLLESYLPLGTAPVYPKGAQCNARGLTDLGDHAVRAMMDKGMIVDPDHLSVRSRKQVLSLLEAKRHGGAISSHTWSSPDATPRIYELGGVVTPYAGDSKAFVQAWRQTKPKRNPKFFFGFGYGADMNGFGSQGGPRNGPNPVRYPFKSIDGKVTLERQKSGSRTFDINTDGVAHYGLYPDWLEDLRMQAGDEIVKDMANGAEGYLQMWERSMGVPALNRCRPARGRLTAKGLSRVRLGLGPVALLKKAGQPVGRTGRAYRYCVRGNRGDRNAKAKIVALFDGKEKATLVGTTARGHRSRTVKRAGGAKLRRSARKLRKGILIRRAQGGKRFVFGVRRGKVSYVAVASRSASKSKRRLRTHLRLAGLR